MKKIEIKGKEFKRAWHYAVDDSFIRVILIPKNTKPDRYEIEVSGYQVDKKGNIVEDSNGAPVQYRTETRIIPRLSLGDTTTLEPGWLPIETDESLITADCFFEEMPEIGSNDQIILVKDLGAFRYSDGVLEDIRKTVVQALAAAIKVTEGVKSNPEQELNL